MNRIRRITVTLAALAATVLAFTAASPAAFAVRLPPPGEGGGLAPAPPPVHVIVTGGMPGWQITLIAAAAALLAAVLAVSLDRARAARRHISAPST
jgi:hypothetical protein